MTEPTTPHGVIEAILADRDWPHGVPRPVAATPHTARVVLDVTGGKDDAHGYKGYAGTFDRVLCRQVIEAGRIKRSRIHRDQPAMVDAVDLYERAGLAAALTLAGIDKVME